MSNTPAPCRSQHGPTESMFAPHRASSLCRTWLSQTETDNLYASAAPGQSPMAITTNESDSALGLLSIPSKRHHDLEGLEAQRQSDSYSLAKSSLELSPTGSFARSKHELQMQHSPDPLYTPIVVQLPNRTPKKPKTAVLVTNRYENARSASVISSSLASTAADSTKTVLKYIRSSSAASDRSQTPMFALGFWQLNLTDPAAPSSVDQVIGDERSSITPPVSPGLTQDTSSHSHSVCLTQPYSTFVDPYSTTCWLRGGGGPGHQCIPNSIQNTPQSAYGPRFGRPHYSRSFDTSRPLSPSGSLSSSGSNKEVKKPTNFIHVVRQKATHHETIEPTKPELGHYNINRQKGRAPKPTATTRQLDGLSQKDAWTDTEGSTTYYAEPSIPRRQSEAVQSSPFECVSGPAYFQKHLHDQTPTLKTDHGTNTQSCSSAIPSLPRIRIKHGLPVSQPSPLPSAKPNLHIIIESYLSVLESIIETLDVQLQNSRPSPSLRGGCCSYCCCCLDEREGPPFNNRAPPFNNRASPSNIREPQSDNREQLPENPTSTPPRGRAMDRQERLFRKSYAETNAIELHEFKQGQFRKSVGGDSLSSKGQGKKVLNVTDTAVRDNSGSNATDTAAGDNSTSSLTGPSDTVFEPTSSMTNPSGSIFGPFSPTCPNGSTLASTRTPLAWEDPVPSWSFSQAVPHPRSKPRLRGGGANEEDEESEGYEQGDATYQRSTMLFEEMCRTNSCPERLQSNSQSILSNPHFRFARSRSRSQGEGEGEGEGEGKSEGESDDLFEFFLAPLQPGDMVTPMANISAVRTKIYSKHHLGRRYADAADIRQARKDVAQAFENQLTLDLTLTDPRVRAKLTAISVVWGWLRGGSGGDDEDEEDPKDASRDAVDKEEDPKDIIVEVADKEEEVWEELPPRSNSNMFHPAYYDRTPRMGPNPKPVVEKPRDSTNEFAPPPVASPHTYPPPPQIRLPGGNWVFTYNSETRIYEPTYVGPRPNAPQSHLRNDGSSQPTQDRGRLDPDNGSAQTTTPENPEKLRQAFEEVRIDDGRGGSPPPPYSE